MSLSLRWPLDPSGYKFRALRNGHKGYDVYALQSGLHGVVGTVAVDGDFGPATEKAVWDFQYQQDLVRDGIAGTATQRALALRRVWPVQAEFDLPPGLMRGQIEKESTFVLGNHTPRYDNGHYDCGVCQRNSQYTEPDQGFRVPESIRELGRYHDQKYRLYKGWGKIRDERRLRELAAGAWNAPAWTDRLAKGESLSESQRTWIEAYIDRVTVYMVIR